jgi:hypothetical protein
MTVKSVLRERAAILISGGGFKQFCSSINISQVIIILQRLLSLCFASRGGVFFTPYNLFIK